MEDYESLDAGDRARLERFGPVVVARPHAGAEAPRRDPDAWAAADLEFDRATGWRGLEAVPEDWAVTIGGVRLGLRATDTGQVGCFPEHGTTLSWLLERAHPSSQVLHLFAYTGLTTLALARAGAEVTHVDASRPAVGWARDNAARSGLSDRPIRWLVEDARRYVDREIRRGRRYDGVVLDPPTYGHGTGAITAWRIERDLPALLEQLGELLSDHGWLLLTAHTEGLTPDDLGDVLRPVAGRHRTIDRGTLAIESRSGARLELGSYARMAPVP